MRSHLYQFHFDNQNEEIAKPRGKNQNSLELEIHTHIEEEPESCCCFYILRMLKVYSKTLLVICAIILVTGSSPAVNAGGDHQHHELGWIPAKSPCRGSIAECLEGGEFELDSEINRRILATTRYISYGALQRNSVPCSRRGASYYNCRPGAQANPYRRGCSAITRCRS